MQIVKPFRYSQCSQSSNHDAFSDIFFNVSVVVTPFSVIDHKSHFQNENIIVQGLSFDIMQIKVSFSSKTYLSRLTFSASARYLFPKPITSADVVGRISI